MLVSSRFAFTAPPEYFIFIKAACRWKLPTYATLFKQHYRKLILRQRNSRRDDFSRIIFWRTSCPRQLCFICAKTSAARYTRRRWRSLLSSKLPLLSSSPRYNRTLNFYCRTERKNWKKPAGMAREKKGQKVFHWVRSSRQKWFNCEKQDNQIGTIILNVPWWGMNPDLIGLIAYCFFWKFLHFKDT